MARLRQLPLQSKKSQLTMSIALPGKCTARCARTNHWTPAARRRANSGARRSGRCYPKGQTEQQIKDYFVAGFGVRVLAQPPAQGTSLLLYVLPIMGLMVGVVIVVWLLRRLRARGAQALVAAPAPKSSGDEYTDRVERDLKNY